MSSKPSRSEIETALSGRTKRRPLKPKRPVQVTFDLDVPPRRQQVLGGDLTGISAQSKKGILNRYNNISISYWIGIALVALIMLAFFWPKGGDPTREVTSVEVNSQQQLDSAIQPIDVADTNNNGFARDSDVDRANAFREQNDLEVKIRDLLQRAELHNSKGRYTQPLNDNAVQSYRAVLALDPGNASARQGIEAINQLYFEAGLTALGQDNQTVAQNALQALASVDPQSEPYLELDSAINTWKVSVQMKDLLSKADQAFSQDNLILPAKDNALYYYRQVLIIDEGNEAAAKGVQKVADIFIERANTAVLQGQYQAAAAHLATVTVIDPNHSSIALIEAMMTTAKPLADQAAASNARSETALNANQTAAPESSAPEIAEDVEQASTKVVRRVPARTNEQRTPAKQSGEQADFDRQYLKQGLDAYYKGEYKKAAALLQPLADKGVARAQLRLAYMHFLGRGFRRDRGEADRITRAALPAIQQFADEGRAWAQSDIGSLYEDGLVLPKDYGEAVYWYRSAAEQGYPGAQTNLGMMYARGRGVTSSRRTAIEWFQRAAKQGDSVAKRNLEALGVN